MNLSTFDLWHLKLTGIEFKYILSLDKYGEVYIRQNEGDDSAWQQLRPSTCDTAITTYHIPLKTIKKKSSPSRYQDFIWPKPQEHPGSGILKTPPQMNLMNNSETGF